LARHLLGPVTSVTARGRIGVTGVDEDCVLVLTHHDGALSTIRASLRASGANTATLSGSKATVHVEAPIYRPERMRIVATVPQEGMQRPKRFAGLRESGPAQRLLPLVQRLRGAGGRSLRFPVQGNGYGHEALALMEAVARGQTQSDVMPLSESIEIMEIIDAALAQIRAQLPAGRGA
jgi:predicted dehydrogenase